MHRKRLPGQLQSIPHKYVRRTTGADVEGTAAEASAFLARMNLACGDGFFVCVSEGHRSFRLLWALVYSTTRPRNIFLAFVHTELRDTAQNGPTTPLQKSFNKLSPGIHYRTSRA